MFVFSNFSNIHSDSHHGLLCTQGIYGGLAHFLGQRHICVKGGRDDEHKMDN